MSFQWLRPRNIVLFRNGCPSQDKLVTFSLSSVTTSNIYLSSRALSILLSASAWNYRKWRCRKLIQKYRCFNLWVCNLVNRSTQVCPTCHKPLEYLSRLNSNSRRIFIVYKEFSPSGLSAAMPASSFLVGLAASMATSFAILEKVSDRRCFELRRDVNDAFIESSIYKSVSLTWLL